MSVLYLNQKDQERVWKRGFLACRGFRLAARAGSPKWRFGETQPASKSDRVL